MHSRPDRLAANRYDLQAVGADSLANQRFVNDQRRAKAFSRINRPRRHVRRRPSCASSIRNGRPASCAKRTSGPPLLIGLTPRCFAHSARASCAPLVNPSGAAAPRHLPLVQRRLLASATPYGCATIRKTRPRRPRALASATPYGCATIQKAPLRRGDERAAQPVAAIAADESSEARKAASELANDAD